MMKTLSRFKKKQKQRILVTFLIYFLVGILVLLYFCYTMYKERADIWKGWDDHLADSPEQAQMAKELSAAATRVTVGTYLENLRELNLKGSYYRVEFLVWFSWEGDAELNPAENFRVYKGLINTKRVMQDIHDGTDHYQLVFVDVSVSKDFETKRFPLESHQMRFYVESTNLIQDVVFVPDYENSGLNENLTLSGYDFIRHDIGVVSYLYESSHGDPLMPEPDMTSEIVTAFEINRSSFGMYFKCFIALWGTIVWVLIALFICTYHRVDPLGMIPGALFGAVGNIMIGANLLPDSLEMGLLEYVNLWGVICILGIAIAIININQVRKTHEDNAFAHYYGTILFYTMLVFSIGGQVLLPLFAYVR